MTRNKLYEGKLNIGLSLVLVGVPLGMYLNDMYPIVKWSPIIMTLSVLLIFNWKNLIHLSFPSYSKIYGVLLLFQLICLMYGAFSSNMSGQYMSFHLFLIALCLAISTVSVRTSIFAYPKLIGYVFTVSVVCCILGAYNTFRGRVTGDEVYMLKQLGEYAIEPFTVAMGSLVNYFAGLMMLRVSKFRFFVFFAMLLDVYTILFTDKRTPLFVLVVGMLWYLYVNDMLHFSKRMIKGIGLIVLVFVCLYSVDFFQNKIDYFIENTYNGVLVLFGDTSVSDATGSAIERTYSRRWMADYIALNGSLYSTIFGFGYMTKWLDAPILQAYLDMGIIGFFFYLYLIVVFPVRIIIKKYNAPTLVFALAVSLYSIASIINSGIPYQYVKYTPVVFLAFCYNVYKKEIKHRKIKNI